MTSATETQAKLLDTFVNTAQKNGWAMTETIRVNEDQLDETYVSAISITKESPLLDLHPLRCCGLALDWGYGNSSYPGARSRNLYSLPYGGCARFTSDIPH